MTRAMGRLNMRAIGAADTGWKPEVAEGTLIFRQGSTTNEAYETRQLAFWRAQLLAGTAGNASRTYFSNAARQIGPPEAEQFGQGNLHCYMEDRHVGPTGAYGRYYDYKRFPGDVGRLVVEHTDDPEPRLIEIVSVSPGLTVSFRRWEAVPHFHAARFTGMDRFSGGVAVGTHPQTGAGLVYGPPPRYDAVQPDHHIYYLEDAHVTPVHGLEKQKLAAFEEAFTAGAEAVFDLVWPTRGP